MYLAEGNGCKEHYEATEITAQGCGVYKGPGVHHRKALVLGPYKLSGSCNWTVSSLGNQEEDHFLWMNQAGIDFVDGLEATTFQRRTPLGRAQQFFRCVDAEGYPSPYKLKDGLGLARPAAG